MGGLGLAIGGIGSVLAEEVLAEQSGLHWLEVRIDTEGLTREAGDELQHRGVVDRVRHAIAPGKWTVAGQQHGGVLHGIQLPEPRNDDMASVRLVIGSD